jgi:hypothetical protein
MERKHLIVDMEADLPADINGVYTRVDDTYLILVNSTLPKTVKEVVLNEGYQYYDNKVFTEGKDPYKLVRKIRLTVIDTLLKREDINHSIRLNKRASDDIKKYLSIPCY